MIDLSSAKVGDVFYKAFYDEDYADGIEILEYRLYKRDEKYPNYLYFTLDYLSGYDKSVPESGYSNTFTGLKSTKEEAIFEAIKEMETKVEILKSKFLTKYDIYYMEDYYHGCEEDLLQKIEGVYGYNFESACREYFAFCEGNTKWYGPTFDKEKLTFNGHKLYPTEQEARANG